MNALFLDSLIDPFVMTSPPPGLHVEHVFLSQSTVSYMYWRVAERLADPCGLKWSPRVTQCLSLTGIAARVITVVTPRPYDTVITCLVTPGHQTPLIYWKPPSAAIPNCMQRTPYPVLAVGGGSVCIESGQNDPLPGKHCNTKHHRETSQNIQD